MAKRTLDHAAVRIADLERSRRFYEGLLGLSAVTRPDFGFPGMWYGLGDAQLHLIQREQTAGGGLDPTNPHFAIEVDDLPSVRERLVAAGLEILEFGGAQMWVRDPDGYTVELRQGGVPR